MTSNFTSITSQERARRQKEAQRDIDRVFLIAFSIAIVVPTTMIGGFVYVIRNWIG